MTYYFIVDTTASFYPEIVSHPEGYPLRFKSEEEAVNYANASIGSYEILKIDSE